MYPFDNNPYSFPSMSGLSPYSMPSTMQTQPAQPANNGPVVLYVPNVNQVREVDMRGISKALIIVQNEPVIAMRTADSMGLTNTEYYSLTKYDPEAVQTPAPEYVTRKEFNDFVASLAGKKEAAE